MVALIRDGSDQRALDPAWGNVFFFQRGSRSCGARWGTVAWILAGSNHGAPCSPSVEQQGQLRFIITAIREP